MDMMDRIDQKIKELWLKISHREGADRTGQQCPTDEGLAQYLDGALEDAAKDEMEQHLLVCRDCLNLVMTHEAAKEAEGEVGTSDAPAAWMKRAMDLVPQKTRGASRLVDAVVRFARETLEIIANPGELTVSYGAVPVPVRGGSRCPSGKCLTLRKSFAHIEAYVEIERIEDDRVNLTVQIQETDNSGTQERMRVSLLNPDAEIASYIVKEGHVQFSDLALGDYVVRIVRRGEPLGEIALSLTE